MVRGSGDGWWEQEADPGAGGIDQFLCNADQLNRGLRSAMVTAFTALLLSDGRVTKIQTDPSPENERAIRSYKRAGFEAVREVDTPDGRALLMIKARTDKADQVAEGAVQQQVLADVHASDGAPEWPRLNLGI